MAERNIRNIFPLIDDPANIFYSKIKQWMQLQTNFHLHCKAVSRVDRVVEASFMGISRTYKTKFKTYEVLKEEDIGQYLYICYTFVASSKVTEENTSSGERIPVDIDDIYLLEDKSYPIVLQDQTATILYEETGTWTKPHYEVYIRVNKVYKNEYSQLDIVNTEKCYEELHFEDAYRQSVGRLWVLRPPLSDTSKHYCDADSLCSWELYNIDSENHYTLMDKSNTPPDDFNTTHIWPIQYGPGLDHRARFIALCKTEQHPRHPYLELDQSDFWVEVREKEWSNTNISDLACLTEEAEAFLNTRGHVPAYFPYLFRGLHFNCSTTFFGEDLIKTGEGCILLLSYICNMNIRYLLCRAGYSVVPASGDITPVVGTPLREVLLHFASSTNVNDVNAYKILNLDTEGLSKYYLGKTVTTMIYGDTVEVTSNLENTESILRDYVENALNDYITIPQGSTTATMVGLPQNSLLSRVMPHLKWYIRQFVYAISFLKYGLFKIGRNVDNIMSMDGYYYVFAFFTSSDDFLFLEKTILNSLER